MDVPAAEWVLHLDMPSHRLNSSRKQVAEFMAEAKHLGLLRHVEPPVPTESVLVGDTTMQTPSSSLAPVHRRRARASDFLPDISARVASLQVRRARISLPQHSNSTFASRQGYGSASAAATDRDRGGSRGLAEIMRMAATPNATLDFRSTTKGNEATFVLNDLNDRGHRRKAGSNPGDRPGRLTTKRDSRSTGKRSFTVRNRGSSPPLWPSSEKVEPVTAEGSPNIRHQQATSSTAVVRAARRRRRRAKFKPCW
jgi:hypothetical protein